MWSERLAPAYFSKGPGVAFAIRASTAIFGDTEFGVRFWSPILGAGTSLLLYYFARRLFNATAGFWAVHRAQRDPAFQRRQPSHDDRSALDLFLDGGHVHLLAGARAQSEFFLALARDRSAHRARVSLQIHERASSSFPSCSCWRSSRACAANSSGPASIFFSALSRFAWCRRSSGTRSTPGSRWLHLRSRGESRPDALGFHPLELLGFLARAFLLFFAAPLSRARLGGHRELAPRAPAIQGALSRLVRSSGLSVLFPASRSTSRPRQTGTCSRLSAWAVLAAPIGRSACAASRKWRRLSVRRAVCSASAHESARAQYRSSAQRRACRFPGAIRRIACAAGNQRPGPWKKSGPSSSRRLGEQLFLIADQRDRASEMSFYLRAQTRRRSRASAGLHRRIAGHQEPVLLLAALR